MNFSTQNFKTDLKDQLQIKIGEQKQHAYEQETSGSCFSSAFSCLLGVQFMLVSDCSALRVTFTKRELGYTLSHVNALSKKYRSCE